MTTWGTACVAGLAFRREGTGGEGPRWPGWLLGTLDSFLHLKGRRVISRAEGAATGSLFHTLTVQGGERQAWGGMRDKALLMPRHLFTNLSYNKSPFEKIQEIW